MSPNSWPQWFPAFERSQKKITECHSLIMYFRVSLDVLLLFGNSASPFWSFSLSFPIIPRHAFIFLLLSLSAHFHFFSSFFFSYFKFLIQLSSPVLSVLPGPLLFLYPCVLFYIAASLHQCSDSFLLCFTFLHGQVAEQLAYYGHVSETVITEEMFDAAVQFGTVQGDPTQS